ncbi:hypothetical protein [Azonexus sp.]|uniref:hypothetical protein n=1 Tax=Azonexus sp. TaxID=1872668 RepID=UPI0039E2C0F6
MIDSIAGAFGAIKGAAEITQGLLSLKTDAAVATKATELTGIIFDVQQKLIAIQSDYAAVVARERDLEAKIMQLENWAHEQERYQLHELAPGTLTYRIKPAMQGTEPMHDLCPRCYQNGIKSILQNNGIEKGHHILLCPQCKTALIGERFNDSAGAAMAGSFRSRRLI